MAEKHGELNEKLMSAPGKPGVYIFKDDMERVLYVGKAKDLRKRLKSYFRKKSSLDPKTLAMMRRVAKLSFTVTETEVEALALEANLIKQYMPGYNIILRDDKNYPYLKLTVNEEWPRLEVVRRVKKDGALYFGPYIPASSARETVAFIRRHFNVRPCRYKLDRPIRPCVQYQMGRCPAPCDGLISREDYKVIIKDVERFLKSENAELLEALEGQMQRLSDQLRYEEAARVRDRLNAISGAFESQRVVSIGLGDLDVIGSFRDGSRVVFQVLFVRNGVMIGTKDFYLSDIGQISDEELSGKFLELFYSKELIPPAEITLQVLPEGHKALLDWLAEKKGKKVRMKVPQRGRKVKLLKMALENSRLLLKARRYDSAPEIAAKLKERLGLKELPESIGAFDVSTISGSHSVGAFIWWEDGEFRKEFYRHFRIKGVRGVDDYAMMREIVVRAIENLKERMPDLIMIDGGRAHLDVVLRAVSDLNKTALQNTDIIAVAKGPDRAVLGDGRAVHLDDGSPETLLLRRIRDEVHRFAISYHRKLRSRSFLESRLEKIEGIGRKRRLALLKRFGSIENIRKAAADEIENVEWMNRKLAEKVLSEL